MYYITYVRSSWRVGAGDSWRSVCCHWEVRRSLLPDISLRKHRWNDCRLCSS